MTDAEPAVDRPRVVLIAEDDRDIRELVAAKLSSAGYQVIAVADGTEALTELRERLPDLALLDVMMPGVSGLELLRELRRDPATTGIPIILMSAKSQEFDVESGIALGAADYVVKPFSPRELLARVESILQQASL